MPHIIFECSKNVFESQGIESLDRLMSDLSYVLANMLPTKLNHCKSRLYVPEIYFLGSNGDSAYEGFIHISISILKGRSKELLDQILEILMLKTKEHTKISEAKYNVQISIEIKELSDFYLKNTK
jgi:5-carboxymethyl-2-hydroxymuconate isomerase